MDRNLGSTQVQTFKRNKGKYPEKVMNCFEMVQNTSIEINEEEKKGHNENINGGIKEKVFKNHQNQKRIPKKIQKINDHCIRRAIYATDQYRQSKRWARKFDKKEL